MFDILLVILVKIGLFLVVILFLLRWFIFIPYIWFKYDRQILKIKDELNKFKDEQRSKPATIERIEGSIRQKTITVNEKLDIVETQRKLFIDRVNLFLSISSISKF